MKNEIERYYWIEFQRWGWFYWKDWEYVLDVEDSLVQKRMQKARQRRRGLPSLHLPIVHFLELEDTIADSLA